ncbi:MAG TPA: hypothetical protein VFT72_05680 [Opitutaceae bacterium]|nr:hypothetical protein [Opitutaceae bacterium]
MKTSHLSRLTLAAGLTFLPMAHAAFEPGVVSSDAKWVLNVDFNTLRETSLGKELIADAAKFQAEKTKTMSIGVDWSKLLATIGSVTAYGSNFTQDPHALDGTLVVQGTDDFRKIAEAYVTQASVSTPEQVKQIEGFAFDAYAVGGANGLVIAFPPERIVILSKSKDQILKAREVFRGRAASLKKASDSPLNGLVKNSRDTFLTAASVIPSGDAFPANAPQARILQMAQSGSLSIGESNNHATAHLELVAANDTMADKLAKILQGFAAMASLAQSNDKQLTEFLQSISVKRDDQHVTLELAYPSERLIQMLHDLSANALANENNNAAPPAVKKPASVGTTIAEWTGDQDLESDGPTAGNLVYRTIEHVALKQGTTILITGRADKGEQARLDVVEITPDAGGPALKFEAEYMTLRHYQRETFAAASGGKLIATRSSSGSARFQFPAEDGSYTIKVRYVDEKDGQSHFAVKLLSPETAPESAE